MRAIILLLVAVSFVGCARKSSDDRLVLVEKRDPEMDTATEDARKSLPSFWRSFEAPAADESEFFVKFPISDGKNTEHFWIGSLRREGGKLVGLVANYPQLVRNVQIGQKATVREDLISDWKFMKSGRMKGGYTIAVLLRRIPAREADEIRKQIGWN